MAYTITHGDAVVSEHEDFDYAAIQAFEAVMERETDCAIVWNGAKRQLCVQDYREPTNGKH